MINCKNTTLENVFIQIPTFVFWKDCHSVFLGCNSNFSLAAGFKSPREIVGKTDYDLIWGDQFADSYREGDKQVLDGVFFINMIEKQLQSNNRLITVLLNKVPLLNRKGQKIGIIGSYTELTESKFYGNFNIVKDNITLTNKQAECLFLLVLGKSAKQIAYQNNVSVRTIEHQIEMLKIKLQCKNKQALIAKALRLDFIKARLLCE